MGPEIEKKRRHKRAPLSAHVRLLVDEGARTLILRGLIVEISLSGAGLYLAQPPDVGAQVKLELSYLVASGEIKTETVGGTAIYSKYIHDTYFVGIEFDRELDPKDQPDLYSRIQDILISY
ncbi:MAG: PilZ domain-containing protein [Nitrospirota bacterium]|jgi:hypothetical protein